MNAQSLIKRAYVALGVKTLYDIMSAAEAQYGLDTLNALIDSWNTQSLFIYNIDPVVTTVSTSPVTVGMGGTIDMVRPLRFEAGGFLRINNADYPLVEISREEYADIAFKGITSSIPYYYYYSNDVPLGSLYLFPVPAPSAELHLFAWVKLTKFADLGTEYQLSDGYERALVLSLAEELSIGIAPVSETLARKAMQARQFIRDANVEVPKLSAPIRINTFARLQAGI